MINSHFRIEVIFATVIAYPNAKINLGLNVLRNRNDGYHEIESVFYPIPWFDVLEIVPDSGKGEVEFTSSGIEIPSDGTANLCERVYQLFSDEFAVRSVKIHLHKTVPIGAGLGGGSADAAFCAVMLNKLFDLGLPMQRLEQIVSEVGSDCPFFIKNQPAYVSGRGEILELTKVDLSGLWIYLINPQLHIGTKEAYGGIVPSKPVFPLNEALDLDFSHWQATVKNDFEKSIFKIHPEVERIKSRLIKAGAKYASMTGSGSTVYGLFETEPKQLPFSTSYITKIAQL